MAEIRIVEESFRGKEAQLEPLLAAHREELEPSMPPISPVWANYAALEGTALTRGNLVALFAYDGDRLIGYSASFVNTHLHYNVVYGHNDVFYLLPEYRRGGIGARLRAQTIASCKARGAVWMAWHAKPDTAMDKMLARMKTVVRDNLYVEEI